MKVRWTNTVVAFGMALGTGACAVGTDEIDEKEAATSSREIVGGSNTTIAENPWQISLGDSSGFQFCGGTVLSASWILTANHCVTGESPSGLRVNAGFTKQSQRGTGQTRNVSQIVRYPGYSSPENGEDAALLKLSTPLDLSGPNVKAIPYMTPDVAATATAPGAIARVTGWGTLSSGGSTPDTLQAVDVPIISNAQAQSGYGTQETITEDQLAAAVFGVGGKDSCQGDSGGPLTVNTSNGRAVAGVVSWGYGCGSAQYAGLYGRVSSFASWIATTTNGEATPIGDVTDPGDPGDPGDPDPTEVVLLSRTNFSGAKDSFQHFPITVAAGTTKLVVAMSGGTGDGDLYVRRGSQPTTSVYDCRPYLNGNQETCTINNPVAGTFYVSVRGYSAFSGAGLTATATVPGGDPGDPGDPGPSEVLSRSNLSGTRGSFVHFPVVMPAGTSTLTVVMSGGTGDADLYVRKGAQPTTAAYDCRPYKGGNSETCTITGASGTIYVSVHGYSAFSGVSLVGTAD